MMRRGGSLVVMALLAVATVAVGPVHAVPCKKACAVFMRKDCRKSIHTSVKAWQDLCKSLFDPHTHKCLPGKDCMGFANLSKCRTAGTQAGSQEARNKCGPDARKTCQACCASGGTNETCVHSPSGAFLDF